MKVHVLRQKPVIWWTDSYVFVYEIILQWKVSHITAPLPLYTIKTWFAFGLSSYLENSKFSAQVLLKVNDVETI